MRQAVCMCVKGCLLTLAFEWHNLVHFWIVLSLTHWCISIHTNTDTFANTFIFMHIKVAWHTLLMACCKNTEFPLDVWCGTFNLWIKGNLFFLVINVEIRKTSEHSLSFDFVHAHTYLFSLMRCCPYLPPSLSFCLFAWYPLLHLPLFCSVPTAPRIQELSSISSSTPPIAWHHLPVLLLVEVSGRAQWASISPSQRRTGGVNSLCLTAGVHAK